jgi:hypothetical protein
VFSVVEINASKRASADAETASNELLVYGNGYTVRIEYNEDYVILHLSEIDKFTKEVFCDMQFMLYQWSKFIRAMGKEQFWAAVPKDNIKIKRLLGGLRFKFVGHKDDMSVYSYEV